MTIRICLCQYSTEHNCTYSASSVRSSPSLKSRIVFHRAKSNCWSPRMKKKIHVHVFYVCQKVRRTDVASLRFELPSASTRPYPLYSNGLCYSDFPLMDDIWQHLNGFSRYSFSQRLSEQVLSMIWGLESLGDDELTPNKFVFSLAVNWSFLDICSIAVICVVDNLNEITSKAYMKSDLITTVCRLQITPAILTIRHRPWSCVFLGSGPLWRRYLIVVWVCSSV